MKRILKNSLRTMRIEPTPSGFIDNIQISLILGLMF